MILDKIKVFISLLKRSGEDFFEDNALQLSASLSYFTIFSLAPILIIIISLAGLFFGQDAVQGQVYGQIRSFVSNDAALQIQSIIANIQNSNHGSKGAIVGAALLLVGATGVFAEIQSSVNFIWSIKSKPTKSWLKFLLDRLLSFSLVLIMAGMLLVSLIFSTALAFLNEELLKYFDESIVYVFHIADFAFMFVVITLLFSVIFKVLPDAKIKWYDTIVGSIFTAVLFTIGKLIIGYYLTNSTIGQVYGTAASLVLILAWVYYSSIILYFGAEFTKVFAYHVGSGITPSDNAVFIMKHEVDILPSRPLNNDENIQE